MAEGKKTCPLCDTEMEADAKECPSCGVDLSIFDLDKDGKLDFDTVTIDDDKSLDELLAEITKSEEISSDIVEDLKSIGKNATDIDELDIEKAPEGAETPPEGVGPGEVPKPDEGEKEAEPEAGTEGEKIKTLDAEAAAGEIEAEPEAEVKEEEAGIEETSAEAPSEEAPADEEERFECPSCGTLLPVSSTMCFNCGVEFAEEEVFEFECPECKTLITGEASKCPNCGAIFEFEEAAKVEEAPEAGAVDVTEEPSEVSETTDTVESVEARIDEGFTEGEASLVSAKPEAKPPEEVEEEVEEKDPYMKLQELVAEVKPLLIIAKRYDIDVTEGKDLINKAIMAGKGKDIRSALGFVRESKTSVESILTDQISGRLDKLKSEVEDANARGIEVDISGRLNEALRSLQSKDYESSIQSYFKAMERFETSAGDFVRAKDDLHFMEELLENSKYLHFDVSEGAESLEKLKSAIDKKDWVKAGQIADAGREKILRALPSQIQTEMRNARELLLDWKSKNMDITIPIGHLKEASIALKNGEHAEALKFLVLFKKETKTL